MRLGKTLLYIAAIVGLLAPAGCGGDDDGVSGPSHGVSGGKPANQLTQQEIQAIVDDAKARRAEAASAVTAGLSVEQTCNTAGLLAGAGLGGSVSVCQLTRDTCLQNPQLVDLFGGSSANPGATAALVPTTQQLAACTVTVDEIDDCVNARVREAQQNAQAMAAAIDKYKNYTCNEVGQVDMTSLSASAAGGTGTSSVPPECQALYANCPALQVYI